MAKVNYAGRAFADLDRLALFLESMEPGSSPAAIDVILGCIEMLGLHPLVGRPVDQALRELVISRGRSGYLALYSYERQEDVALMLAIRHQREAGYIDLD